MAPQLKKTGIRVAGALLLIALALVQERLLYFHPDYFRPDSRHFDWHRVAMNIAVLGGAWLLIERISLWRRVDLRSRRALTLGALATWPYITQWVVADHGVSGWDVLGRSLTLIAFTIIAVNLWPKQFGIR